MASGMYRSSGTPGSRQNDSTDREDGPGSHNSLRNGLSLPLNGLAVPGYDTPTREDVEQDAQFLYQNFVREEFEREGIDDAPEVMVNFAGGDTIDGQVGSRFRAASPAAAAAAVGTPEGYKNSEFTKLGRTLRELSDQFANSKEGQIVRQEADNVNLNDINHERFLNLLIALFSCGFSRERIIALFYFCTLLLIRAAKENGMDLCRQLFTWSLRYIVEHVCQWVQEHGGWGRVLSNIYDVVFKVVVVSALVVAIGVGIVYIRKNW